LKSNYYTIITHPTHMFWYVSRCPSTHTSTYEYDEISYWKQMGFSTNYVYNGPRTYSRQWPRIFQYWAITYH